MTRASITSPMPYKRARPGFDWSEYDPGDFYDEIISSPGNARAASRGLVSYIRKLTIKHLISRQQAADLAIQEMGISFTVYSEGQNIDRSWPMDILPRIISLREWQDLEAGLVQRLTALNMFIDDIYNKQRISQGRDSAAGNYCQFSRFPRAVSRRRTPLWGLVAYLWLRPGAR